MDAHVTSIRTYATTLAILIALTFLTVGVSFVPLEARWHIAAGLSIGAVKALLVAFIFMHLTSAPRLISVVVAIALLWFLLLSGLTFCDYSTRGLIESLPGH